MKSFKIFLVSMLLISILTTSILLCACDKDDNTEKPPADDFRDADWIKVYSCSNNLKDYTYSPIINSVEEILTLCDEDNSPIFYKNDHSNNRAIEKLKEYDEEFFKNKTLAIFNRSLTRGGLYVKNLEINDELLNVTLINEISKNAVYPTITTTCLYLLELPKEQAKGVTQINVEQITVYVE